MKINLYADFYFDANPDRAAELKYCLEKNIENDLIDSIILYIHSDDADRLKKMLYELGADDKAFICPNRNRPTYNDFFEATKSFQNDDINIISNSDIYFDRESLQMIKEFFSNEQNENFCFALTRWDDLTFPHHDVSGVPMISFYDHADSQDSWVFKGWVGNIPDADFTTGVPGCDNKIAFLLSVSGYRVINPSISVKTIHKHKSGVRNYTRKNTVPPPYLVLPPSKLFQ